ncbi:iron chelate uptake ABC transporter family permease subunit, partial [Aggregatibacter sp.]
MQPFIQRSPRIFFLLLIALLIGSILLALNVGKFPISPSQLWQTIVCSWDSQCNSDSPIHTVLWQIRSPRIVVACLVGAALACAGATYQGMFKNPLVSP